MMTELATPRLATPHPVTVPQVDATAIVVTHNAQLNIADCLRALQAAGLEVRVVDNASTDGTTAVISASFRSVWMIANTRNVGVAAAVNQALTTVETDVVLLVHPNCVPDPDAVRTLVDCVRDDPGVGVAGPRLVGPDGQVHASVHPFASWTRVVADEVGDMLLPAGLRRLLPGPDQPVAPDRPGQPVSVDWVSGVFMAVRTSLLAGLGGLDAGYFLYYEDEALCLQAWRSGARVVYQPRARAVRHGPASNLSDPYATWPHRYRSMLRFFALYRRRGYAVVRLTTLLRALLGLLAAGFRSGSTAGRARLRAWARIARIAFTASPAAIERRDTTREKEGHTL